MIEVNEDSTYEAESAHKFSTSEMPLWLHTIFESLAPTIWLWGVNLGSTRTSPVPYIVVFVALYIMRIAFRPMGMDRKLTSSIVTVNPQLTTGWLLRLLIRFAKTVVAALLWDKLLNDDTYLRPVSYLIFVGSTLIGILTLHPRSMLSVSVYRDRNY
jgi:hypothetical protein